MPLFFKTIFDKFLEDSSYDRKQLRNDRDVILDLYLYYSQFMDNQIKLKPNKRELDKLNKMKILGLSYIKFNGKKILKYIRSSV